MSFQAGVFRASRRQILWGLVLAAALALSSAAAISAHSTLGHRFAALFVDPYGAYAIVQLPTWGMPRTKTRLSPSYRLVAVDGRRLEASRPSQLQRELNHYIRGLPPATHEIQLQFDGPGGKIVITQPLRTQGLDEILFFFVVYALVGWMVLWSGGLVFLLCGRPATGRAYLFWAANTFLFLLTFYDYHTRALLSPLFSVSTVGMPVSALWLAYGFPEPPRWRRELIRKALIALTAIAGITALWLVVGFFAGGDQGSVRSTIKVLIVPSIGALGLSVIVRLRRSMGHSRAELITAIWGLVLPSFLVVPIHTVRLLTGVDSLHLVLPFLVLLLPLSFGYALIRNNILSTNPVLTPRVLMVPMAISGLILAVLGGYAAHWALRYPGGTMALPILFGIGSFGCLVALSRHAAIRLLFPATIQFRPTIKRLSDQLASQRCGATIRQTVDGVVSQWFPTLRVRILSLESLSELAHLPPDSTEKLARGERVWTIENPWHRHLLVPMVSLGELRGVLCVGPKRGAALYTQEDLDLLETIASLGALALHHAGALEELEHIQRFEVEILRGEKQQALGALSTEICHEVVYSLNFIRNLLKQAARETSIKAEDLEIGKEEIGRLKRMISSLRMLDPPSPRMELVAAAVPIQRALHLNRDLIDQKKIETSVEIDPGLKLLANTDLAVQLFANLLRNAAQAVQEGGAIGVRSFEQQGARFIEVWDTGPGIPEPVSKTLFIRRISTKEGGQGIGLTVAYRIARSFRWELSFVREANRTCFRVMIPTSVNSLPGEET